MRCWKRSGSPIWTRRPRRPRGPVRDRGRPSRSAPRYAWHAGARRGRGRARVLGVRSARTGLAPRALLRRLPRPDPARMGNLRDGQIREESALPRLPRGCQGGTWGHGGRFLRRLPCGRAEDLEDASGEGARPRLPRTPKRGGAGFGGVPQRQGGGRPPEAHRLEPPRGAHAARRRRGHATDPALGRVLRTLRGFDPERGRPDLRNPLRGRHGQDTGAQVARAHDRAPGGDSLRQRGRGVVRHSRAGQAGRGEAHLLLHRPRVPAFAEPEARGPDGASAGRHGARHGQAPMKTSLEPPVPLLDLGAVHGPLLEELVRDFERVLRSGQFILGPEHDGFERELAQACGVTHAIGVSSGTAALSIALLALGVEAGDEVIVPAFTYFASASAVTSLGARPVFVDVEPERFGLDPDAAESAITPRTRAIMAVHLYGLSSSLGPLLNVAARNSIPLLEDAAQAIGASDGGRPVGTQSAAAALSFFPTKNLGGLGDAGAILTQDDELASRTKLLRVHGDAGNYTHVALGTNARLDALQAAFLRTKLRRLAAWTEERRTLAARYRRT